MNHRDPAGPRPLEAAWKLLCIILLTFLTAGCERPVAGPLPQRGYVWQRAWTPAVSAAVGEAAEHLQGLVLLGAEVRVAQGKPSVLRATVDWEAVRAAKTPCALALRVAPFGGTFAADDALGAAITDTAKALLAEARAAGVEVTELQLDFDCGQKKLAGYRVWVRAVRAAVRPARLVITTLPAWLAEPEFARLVAEVDGYVLQVHSVPLKENGLLCDPAQARAWVARAGRIGRPFSVALPTYRCTAGYGADGKLLGVAMDAIQPSWPRGTRTLELGARADDLAALVRDWQAARPAAMRELIWYRVPVATDLRNWRWATLSAVMAGRAPAHRLEVRQAGANPIDLSLYNGGEADEALDCAVQVTWRAPQPTAADALSGWTLAVEEGRAIFSTSDGAARRLPPGAERPIGWLRYEAETSIQSEVVEHRPP